MINPSDNSTESNSEQLIAGYCPPHFPIWQDNQKSRFNCLNSNRIAMGSAGLSPIRYVLQLGCALRTRSGDAGNFPSLFAGRVRRETKSPSQFGHSRQASGSQHSLRKRCIQMNKSARPRHLTANLRHSIRSLV
jgi:hypothetical protein